MVDGKIIKKKRKKTKEEEKKNYIPKCPFIQWIRW